MRRKVLRHERVEHLGHGSFTPNNEKDGMPRASEIVGAFEVTVRPGGRIAIKVVDQLVIIEQLLILVVNIFFGAFQS